MAARSYAVFGHHNNRDATAKKISFLIFYFYICSINKRGALRAEIIPYELEAVSTAVRTCS